MLKGKEIRSKVAVADGVNYKSLLVGQMFNTISNLPHRFNPFTPKAFPIYVLDDYAVHLIPEIKKELLNYMEEESTIDHLEPV